MKSDALKFVKPPIVLQTRCLSIQTSLPSIVNATEIILSGREGTGKVRCHNNEPVNTSLYI
jgi:hypothetical protein